MMRLLKSLSKCGRTGLTPLHYVVAGLAMLLPVGRIANSQDFFKFVAPAVAAAPINDARQQQIRAQFEPLLKVEISFAVRACEASDQQRRVLITESKKSLDKLVDDFAKQGGRHHGGNLWMAAGPVRGRMGANGPRERIQAGVAEVVKSQLSAEQTAQYEEECRKRSEFQQQAALDNLIARLDEALFLTSEQRAEIGDDLDKSWAENWAPQLEMFLHGNQMWPNIPNQSIRPHLTAAQFKVWNGMNKVSGQTFFGGMGFGVDGQVIDDIDLDEAEAAPADTNTE